MTLDAQLSSRHRTLPVKTIPIILLSLAVVSTEHGRTEEKVKPAQLEQDKEALAPLQAVVGRWRGTGQLRRGSARGSWSEQATWMWDFDEGRAYLEFRTTKGRYFRAGRLERGKKAGVFLLTAKLAKDSKTAKYSGKRDKDGRLVLTMDPKADHKAGAKVLSAPARVTMRLLAKDKRLVVLYEGRHIESGRFYRLGEVGFTRKGETIAAGSGYPECVVTGGKGTITVEHDGKTYSVCCSGCRDAFDDDPAAVLAEWRARKEKARAKRSAKQGVEDKKKPVVEEKKKPAPAKRPKTREGIRS